MRTTLPSTAAIILSIGLSAGCTSGSDDHGAGNTDTNTDTETQTTDTGSATESDEPTDTNTADTDTGDGLDSSCTGMPAEGCCNGDLLVWCQEGEEVWIDCGANREGKDFCGWLGEAGFFDCAGEDVPPANVITECAQDSVCDTMPAAGCCDGDRLYWCDSGVLLTINCADGEVPFNRCGFDVMNKGFDCNPALDPAPPEYTAECPAGI